MELRRIFQNQSVWDCFKSCRLPVVLYGMGDGADKVIAAFERYGIEISAVMASDGFVRGQTFHGFRVRTLAEVEKEFGDFAVALCFASQLPEVMSAIKTVAARHRTLVPSVPVFGDKLFDGEFINGNIDSMNAAYALMADDLSRRVYENVLKFYHTGELSLLDAITTDKSEAFSLLGLGGNEVYVDLGAYNGDTIREMLEFTHGRYAAIYALEPDKKNFKKLAKFVDGMPHVYAYNAAAWSTDTELPFAAKAGRQSAISAAAETTVEARSVDSILGKRPATIIKMDVEGFEREAIWGASQNIARNSPKMMVSLYHRNEDIFELPLLLKTINPNYKLYIRHQLYIPAWETNLYAVL